jgi:chromosome segregation ATPase
MTSAQTRLHRLSRLLALARAEVVQAEQALANANRALETAVARRQGIDRIIAETRASTGQSATGPLRAGAQLRHLLLPAAGAAAGACHAGQQDREAAETRLRACSARADALEDRLTETRRLCANEAERRRADQTPATRIRR